MGCQIGRVEGKLRGHWVLFTDAEESPEREGELAVDTQLDRGQARTGIQHSLHEPIMVSYNQVSKVTLDFILRKTSQTCSAPCIGPTVPIYQIISRPSPLLLKEGQEAQINKPRPSFLEVSGQGSWKCPSPVMTSPHAVEQPRPTRVLAQFPPRAGDGAWVPL